jgi:hypothetical protein
MGLVIGEGPELGTWKQWKMLDAVFSTFVKNFLSIVVYTQSVCIRIEISSLTKDALIKSIWTAMWWPSSFKYGVWI